MKRLLCLMLSTAFFLAPMFSYDSVFGQDIEGSKDHPMLNRMPGFQISEYSVNEFDAFEFIVGEDERKEVEGKKYDIFYEIADGETAPGERQIVRNYVSALEDIGGQLLYGRTNFATVKVVGKGSETWIFIDAYNSGDNYTLTIIEKQGMEQDIVADASSMSQSIRNTGKVSLYGIYFDSGKADIKPESDASLKEIAKLLTENPSLKLYVVGHTDNDGGFDLNMNLSRERSYAVVRVLTTQYGVSAERLKGYGVASLSPVASNATSDGKALNRRVELVEQ